MGSYDYLANSNRLQAIAGQSITLDAAGNTTSMRGMRLTYNQAGRLALVEQEVTTTAGKGKKKTTTTTLQEIARYTYNALGQRTRKVTPDATTVYHYDLEGQLIAEGESAGALRASYVWADGEPLAQERMTTTGTTTTGKGKNKTTTTGKGKNKTTTTTTTIARNFVYLHTDHLATPRLATDANGAVVWRWNSDVFGSTDATGSVTVNLRFPGQYYDAETRLHYNWFRYYEPETGRHVTSDPIGLRASLNTYAYVDNQPLNWFDRFGLVKDCSYWGGTNCREYEADGVGPFGEICGPVDGNLATWIPDISINACEMHDRCYGDCAKECAGDWCKLSCDYKLWFSNPFYGFTTALFGGDAYEAAKRKEGCYGCEQ
jgi:RHS repeat-associated protein